MRDSRDSTVNRREDVLRSIPPPGSGVGHSDLSWPVPQAAEHDVCLHQFLIHHWNHEHPQRIAGSRTDFRHEENRMLAKIQPNHAAGTKSTGTQSQHAQNFFAAHISDEIDVKHGTQPFQDQRRSRLASELSRTCSPQWQLPARPF